ncbi:MAG: DUF5018 domain-containing protein [Bacteroidales bacterium]|nr:DUF5018 domain-containing protein [Bacteroidales bacterium]
MKRILKTFCLVLTSLIILAGCNKESSEKQILSFKFAALDVQATITESPKAVVAIVPFGTDVTSLVPIITISEKATISPASGVVTDFTNPVVYTVTAEDGSKATYTATVTVNPNGGGGGIDGDPTEYSGNIDVNTSWPDLGLRVDYIIDGPLTVTGNALLTIEPGVTIMFTGVDGGIEVGENAGLRMVGTAEKPIILEGPANNPNNGSWNRVLVHSRRNDNQFEYVRFLRGGSGDQKWNGVVNVRGKLSMKHCLIDGSLNSGLSTEYDGYLNAFEDNVITHCAMYPWITENMFTLCSDISFDNSFTENAYNRVYVDPSAFDLEDDNRTLHALPIPYYFPNGLQVIGTKTFTIEAGTVFEMASGTNLWVNSDCGFIAQGTAEKPIVFRAYDAGTPWSGILFESIRSRNVIEHCQVKECGYYDGWNERCCLYIRADAKLTLKDNVFGPSRFNGVGIEDIENWGNVQHSGNTFTDCTEGNVWIDRGGIYNGQEYPDYWILDDLP